MPTGHWLELCTVEQVLMDNMLSSSGSKHAIWETWLAFSMAKPRWVWVTARGTIKSMHTFLYFHWHHGLQEVALSSSLLHLVLCCVVQTAEELLAAVAGARGKLRKGGTPDLRAAARIILQVRQQTGPTGS